jgi:hypothetical protein
MLCSMPRQRPQISSQLGRYARYSLPPPCPPSSGKDLWMLLIKSMGCSYCRRYQTKDDQINMACGMTSKDTEILGVPESLSAANCSTPFHVLLMIGKRLQDRTHRKAIKFQSNSAYLHTSENKSLWQKHYSPSTRVTYGFLTYYNSRMEEVCMMLRVKHTAFMYELQTEKKKYKKNRNGKN